MMIRICHNDSRDRVGTDESIESFLLERNWIDKIHSFGRPKTSRIQFGFNARIITMPNGEIRSDYVKIGCRSHARDHRRPARAAQTRAGLELSLPDSPGNVCS